MSKAPSWQVYILECADGSLYCGISNNLDARINSHNAGRAARYTRGRGPVVLRYQETCADRPTALRREAAIKRLTRARKLKLIETGGQVRLPA